jgi:hypothetical protein
MIFQDALALVRQCPDPEITVTRNLKIAAKSMRLALHETSDFKFAIECFKAGLLHNVIQDTPRVFVGHVSQICGPQVGAACLALTWSPTDSRSEFRTAVEGNPIAMVVRRALLRFFLEFSDQKSQSSLKNVARRRRRYSKELDRLETVAASRRDFPRPDKARTLAEVLAAIFVPEPVVYEGIDVVMIPVVDVVELHSLTHHLLDDESADVERLGV